MKQFLIALAALAVVHTAVSFAAYRLLTKTTVESARDEPPVERTTAADQTREVTMITLMQTKTMTKAAPIPVVFYMWAGYAGLALAVLYALALLGLS